MPGLMLKDIMKENVRGVEADWPLSRLIEFFNNCYVTGAPVMDQEDRLIGVVSIKDVMRHLNAPLVDAGRKQSHEYYLRTHELEHMLEDVAGMQVEEGSESRVEDIMTPMVFQLPETSSVLEAADLMVRGNIHRLFVTRNGRTVGIVTTMDMVKVVSSLSEADLPEPAIA